MKIKRQLLALVLAAVVAMAMAVPASAATSGTVTISGTIASDMSIELAPSTISYGSVTLGACNPAPQNVSVKVTSNTPWGATITPTSSGSNPLPVSKLYWADGTTAPTCGGASPAGTAFTTGSNTWLMSPQAVTGTTGTTRTLAFALKLAAYETGGTFSIQLLFQVTP